MVRVAIVGMGFWGRNHLRVLNDIEKCEVVGICDIDEERLKQASAKYQVPIATKNFDELIHRSEPDAITICTPSITHAELALKSLGYGVHVLIEKPMATSVEEAAKIMTAAHDSKRVVMVGFLERFNPVVKHAKELVDGYCIGDIILSYSRRIGRWPERIGDVGVVKDTAIHDIDLVRYLFRDNPEQVYAIGGSIRHKYEDHVQAILTFKKGRSAMIEANWLTPKKKREMHITGENGVISLRFIEQEISIEKEDEVKIPIIKYGEPLRLELEYFIDCIMHGKTPSPNAEDGLHSLLIADAILQSMKTGKAISLAEYGEKVLQHIT